MNESLPPRDEFEPRGLWQDLPLPPPDWDKFRREFPPPTAEQQIQAANRYIRERYGDEGRFTHPATYPAAGYIGHAENYLMKPQCCWWNHDLYDNKCNCKCHGERPVIVNTPEPRVTMSDISASDERVAKTCERSMIAFSVMAIAAVVISTGMAYFLHGALSVTATVTLSIATGFSIDALAVLGARRAQRRALKAHRDLCDRKIKQ